ncbi:MAG: FGGY-family carbohydrate kinase [Alkalispirochaeta sp.]
MSVLAVDIGTTRTKAALYDNDLRCRRTESVSTAGISATGTFDVGAVIASLLDVIPRVVSEANGSKAATGISAVGITSFLSHIMYDAAGDVLGPGLSWSFQPDRDALDACRNVCRTAGYQPERPISSELLAPRLVHLARQQPDLVGRIERVVCLKDAIRTALCEDSDAWFVDWSVRDYSLLRDRTDAPITPILDLLRAEGYGKPESLLPPALPAHAPAGALSAEWAHRLGLDAGIPLAAGATDGTTAMYGGGILAENRIVAVFGTTDVVMRAAPAHQSAAAGPIAAGLSRNAAMRSDFEVVGGSTAASGSVGPWMDNLFGHGDDWESIPPGAQGIRVAPGFAGERAPWNRPDTRGMIEGLSLRHTGAHIRRAVLEAQVFRIRLLVERILENTGGAGDPVLLGGGGNRTPALDALRGNVLPWPLRWRRDRELSLCGAAMFACAAPERDGAQRDRILVKLCNRAAADVQIGEGDQSDVNDDSPDKTVYSELYSEWVEWITRVFGGQR